MLFAKVLPVLTGLTIDVRDNLSAKLPRCLAALSSFPRLRVVDLTIYLDELPVLPSQLEELLFSSRVAKQISSISALTNLRTLHLEDAKPWLTSPRSRHALRSSASGSRGAVNLG
jgi:hypothetical protein